VAGLPPGAQGPSILIEVIPLDAGAHEGVNGAFVIAEFADAPSIVYLETALTGPAVERPEDVAAVTLSYETLRAEALSRSVTGTSPGPTAPVRTQPPDTGRPPDMKPPPGKTTFRPERKTGERDCDIGCDPVHDASAHARYLG
jgi:hypothetical protein